MVKPADGMPDPEDPFFRESPGQLARDLAAVLNGYSRENASNTPDFILAAFMLDALAAGEALIRRRDRWYDIHPAPGVRKPSGVLMGLYFNDAAPVAECACGWRTQGDSINDALSAWGRHVTGTPTCREKL